LPFSVETRQSEQFLFIHRDFLFKQVPVLASQIRAGLPGFTTRERDLIFMIDRYLISPSERLERMLAAVQRGDLSYRSDLKPLRIQLQELGSAMTKMMCLSGELDLSVLASQYALASRRLLFLQLCPFISFRFASRYLSSVSGLLDARPFMRHA
jgi:hypothetical protein